MVPELKSLPLKDGTELHCEVFERGKKVWLIGVHGIGEHLGRHHYLRDVLGREINLFQFDLRGHGKSQGESSYIKNFWQYMDDLSEIVSFLQDYYKMEDYFLFGHSMGALIAAGAIQEKKLSIRPKKVFLSAPPIGLGALLGQVINFLPRELFGLLANIPLSVRLKGLVDLNNLSHDPEIMQQYLDDSLTCKSLHSKLLLELVRTSKEVFSRPLRVEGHCACAMGSEDKIADLQSAVDYFSKVEKGVNFKVIDGAYHELHNEIKRYRDPYFEFLKSELDVHSP